MLKAYLALTKTGIILFALVSTLVGYAMSYSVGQGIDFSYPLALLLGMYFVCAGSFAINQAQEWKMDSRMERTKNRPIPSGLIQPWQAYALGFLFCSFGLLILLLLNPLTAGLALLTVFMYNVLYTMIWKRFWVFGAVPGAIPGAMPVVIGYSVNSAAIFSPESMYLFLVMFLWQMPHFWCLAIRYKEDYRSGGIPVLPAQLGVSKTLYHIGLYVFAYVGVALASPWLLEANVLYLLLVLPISAKVLFEFFRYLKSEGQQRWLPFFLWTNLSMLIYLGVPVFDKWFYFISNYYL